MTKEVFFKNLDEILMDRIYLTENLNELNKEIETNHWSIGIDSDVVKQVKNNDLQGFFKKLLQDRIEQLTESGKKMNLIFYSWFDEQTGYLNFNFINSGHENLPFKSEIELTDSIDKIICDFLNSRYLDGIPWHELDNVSGDSDDNEEREFKLIVYKKKLLKNKKA